MIKPEPSLYICNGKQTLCINPVTKFRYIVNSSNSSAASLVDADLLGKIQLLSNGNNMDIPADTAWNLPANIKKIRITPFPGSRLPQKIDFLDAAEASQGFMEIQSTKLGEQDIPQKMIYKSGASANPDIQITVEYLDIQTDPQMPDAMFPEDLSKIDIQE